MLRFGLSSILCVIAAEEAVSELITTHYHPTGSHDKISKVIIELGVRSISIISMPLRALCMEIILAASVLGEARSASQGRGNRRNSGAG